MSDMRLEFVATGVPLGVAGAGVAVADLPPC